MKTALLILVILGSIWFVCNRIWPGKETKLWNTVATRQDKIMDLVFMLGMGIVLLGICYVASKSFTKPDTPQAAVSSARAKRVQPAQNTNPPRRYTPPSHRP